MECTVSKGDYVVISLKIGASFKGRVKNFSGKTRRLALDNVVQMPEEMEIQGCRHFEESEIKEINVISPKSPKLSLTEVEQCEEKNISLKMSLKEYDKILSMQKYFRWIDSESSNLYAAFSALEKCKAIGLYVVDTTTGRMKNASVIGVSTGDDIFLFDLQKLGDNVFDKGLRNILQSPVRDIIVYDCLLLSDCLFHKHKTFIANACDVEAEDLVSVLLEEGYVRESSRSLGSLVESYLGIPNETLYDFDKFCWEARPLQFPEQSFIATQVSYLIPLHREILKRYLKPLTHVNKLFNEYVKNLKFTNLISEGFKVGLRKKLIQFLKYGNNEET